MDSFYKEAPDLRCPACASLDFNAIFNPAQFEALPPLGSPGTTPWTKYVRKVATFSSQSLKAGRSSCSLCSFLHVVASIIENWSVPSALALGLSRAVANEAAAKEIRDGEGYTLAAISSHFIYPTWSGIETRGLTTAMGSSSFTQGPYPPKAAAVWLVLIKGVNTLERLVYESENRGLANLPRALLDQITIYSKNTGTWIAEVTDRIFDDFETAPIHGRLVRPDKIDYGLLQSWLEVCDERHRSCASTIRKRVPHMKLIDCETRALVAAEPTMRYMALSYVWGRAPPEKYSYPTLPKNLPATVEDAMTVARKLGIRYLWVDRYCIWQDDKTHKESQILQMARIYSEAVATIAASSGSDPLYGLPGASRSRLPHSQIVGRLGPRVLVSGAIQRRHGEAIERSAWHTRAWTFQEAILSSRILFFSDYEVSLLCPEAECLEHLTHPIQHLNHWGEKKSTYRTGLDTPRGIRSLILRYSNRSMTFSTDALNAVLGVLSAWGAANDHCYHYWGVPLCFPKSPQRCTDKELAESLWNGLCWRLTGGAVKPATRREGFPSWSWLGIDGRCNIHLTSGEGNAAEYRFKVSTAGKGLVDWVDFVRNGELLSQPCTWDPDLHLEGWIFKIGPFRKANFPPRQVYYVPETDGPATNAAAKRTTTVSVFSMDFGTAGPENLLTDQFEAISTYVGGSDGYAIVFERVGGAGRRIGLLDLQVQNLTDRDMPIVLPQRTVDIVHSFHAERGSVLLR